MTNFSTSQFTYDKSRNVFYANTDVLGLHCYPDTFTLVSAKTGKEIKFVKNTEVAMNIKCQMIMVKIFELSLLNPNIYANISSECFFIGSNAAWMLRI